MGTRLTTIPTPFIKIVEASRPDSDTYVLGGIHIPAGTTNGIAMLFKVSGALGVLPIPLSGTGGKDDSVALKVLPNGTLRVTISEAAVKPDGSSDSGSTTGPAVYDIPGVFPPFTGGPGTIDNLVRTCLRAVRQALVPLG
jgi:hypothetical protein